MTEAPPVMASPPVAKENRAASVLCAVAAFLLLLVFTAAHFGGLLYNALFVLVLIAVPCSFLINGWSEFRRKLVWRFARQPFIREKRRYLVQCCSRWMLWISLGI